MLILLYCTSKAPEPKFISLFIINTLPPIPHTVYLYYCTVYLCISFVGCDIWGGWKGGGGVTFVWSMLEFTVPPPFPPVWPDI